MSKPQGPSSLKRKGPDGGALIEHEKVLHDLICSRQSMGIWIGDIRKETKYADVVVTKLLKSLQPRGLIKLVEHYQNKWKKFYLSKDFEPSKELTGGNWYSDGKLDQEYINTLKGFCARMIQKLKVSRIEGIIDLSKRVEHQKVDLSREQIEEIVNALVLDNEVMEVKRIGSREFDFIPVRKICYKCYAKDVKGEPETGAMASIPCGVCPRISHCTLDGFYSLCVLHQMVRFLSLNLFKFSFKRIDW